MAFFTKYCHKTLTTPKLLNYNNHEIKGETMNTNEKNWSKTLLSSYQYFETICGAIDKTVLNYGINSAMNSDAEFVANKIIALTQRKKFLINTKILIDNILSRLDAAFARILVLKFVDKVKAENASKILGISLRTYFRKINIAIEKFTNLLVGFGYSSSKLISIFENENWVMEIYNNFSKNELREIDADDLHFLGMALSGLKRKTASAY